MKKTLYRVVISMFLFFILLQLSSIINENFKFNLSEDELPSEHIIGLHRGLNI